MKPESELILSQPGEQSKISLIAGKIRVNTKRMIKDGTMDVEMSQAVAGIKGTTFIVEETGDTSTLKVIEGEVEFTSKVTGKTKMVKGGEMITATKK
jgi:ferric-dicitrate binding protein FerR (iron transport regulator)